MGDIQYSSRSHLTDWDTHKRGFYARVLKPSFYHVCISVSLHVIDSIKSFLIIPGMIKPQMANPPKAVTTAIRNVVFTSLWPYCHVQALFRFQTPGCEFTFSITHNRRIIWNVALELSNGGNRNDEGCYIRLAYQPLLALVILYFVTIL